MVSGGGALAHFDLSLAWRASYRKQQQPRPFPWPGRSSFLPPAAGRRPPNEIGPPARSPQEDHDAPFNIHKDHGGHGEDLLLLLPPLQFIPSAQINLAPPTPIGHGHSRGAAAAAAAAKATRLA